MNGRVLLCAVILFFAVIGSATGQPLAPEREDDEEVVPIRYGPAFLIQEEPIVELFDKLGQGALAYYIERDGVELAGGSQKIFARDYQPKREHDFVFRWASVTKQVTAVMIMQEVVKGRIVLDEPVARYLPGFASNNATTMTVRQLLRHQSGLPNPDNTPTGPDGMASYYMTDYKGNRSALTGYCAGPVTGTPGGQWSYNNCDYVVAGALLEKVTGKKWDRFVKERIARPLKLKSLLVLKDGENPDAVQGEPPIAFSAFGSAGALAGSPEDLILFDRALMNGRLLPRAQLAELWDGQPELGFIALGQWVFSVPLEGCDAPVKIVERRGGIGKMQVRNFILPEKKVAAAVFVEGPNFDFGEVWQGSGFSYDMLSMAACVKEGE